MVLLCVFWSVLTKSVSSSWILCFLYHITLIDWLFCLFYLCVQYFLYAMTNTVYQRKSSIRFLCFSFSIKKNVRPCEYILTKSFLQNDPCAEYNRKQIVEAVFQAVFNGLFSVYFFPPSPFIFTKNTVTLKQASMAVLNNNVSVCWLLQRLETGADSRGGGEILQRYYGEILLCRDCGCRWNEIWEKKRRGGMQHSNMTRGTDWFNNQEENHYSSFLLLWQ